MVDSKPKGAAESAPIASKFVDDGPLLEVVELCTHFRGDGGIAKAVDGVSFTLQRGKTLGIVGESGCGKSVTSLSVMRLVPDPPGKIVGGSIRFRGVDLLAITEAQMREIRGNEISMIFQEPMTALNPVFTVGNQVGETVILHEGATPGEARERSIHMLELVGIPSPEKRVDEYPHQLSGGMRQRVMIAMAMACNPSLLIADEPTTALDVTIQAQILELMRGIQEEREMGMLLITHDLAVVAENAHHVAVMYAGKVVEYASVEALYDEPRHPYTRGLFRSLPDLAVAGERLETIPGIVPSAFQFPTGCRFRTRCPYATDLCTQEEPPLVPLGGAGEAGASSSTHTVACHHVEDVLAK